MSRMMRFGRRIALPSTRQIIHELRVIAAEDDARKLAARSDLTLQAVDQITRMPVDGLQS